MLKRTLLIILLVGVYCSNAHAQDAKDEVQLTVSGYADNKEEATKMALRSAIEQAFGTFVSSNTEMLNDAIVKDEIATVSTGNIKCFEYISENIIDGKSYVTLKAIVSINKLIEYVKSKGGTIELAGATFAMNMKMRKLNKKNEAIVLETLINELRVMIPYIFDYEIKVESPKEFKEGIYHCKSEVLIKANRNTELFYDKFHAVMNSISLSESEQAAYIEDNMPLSYFVCGEHSSIGREIYFIKKFQYNDADRRVKSNEKLKSLLKRFNTTKVYSLRDNKTLTMFIATMQSIISQGAFFFRIIDNLGEYRLNRSESYISPYLTVDYLNDGKHKLYFTPSNKERFYFYCNPLLGRSSSMGFIDGISDLSFPSILGVKCSAGEQIFQISLLLCYTEDEIGKISEIKIEPLIAH